MLDTKTLRQKIAQRAFIKQLDSLTTIINSSRYIDYIQYNSVIRRSDESSQHVYTMDVTECKYIIWNEQIMCSTQMQIQNWEVHCSFSFLFLEHLSERFTGHLVENGGMHCMAVGLELWTQVLS